MDALVGMRKALVLGLLCVVSHGFAVEPFNPFENDQGDSSPKVAMPGKEGFRVSFEPAQQTTLVAEISSPVRKVHKEFGDSFEKGDLLIELDDVIFQSSFAKYQAGLEKAKAELATKKQLFDENLLTLLELKAGEADFAEAEANMAVASRNLAATKVLAPYKGKVVAVDVQEFEVAQAGEPLIEIVDDSVLLARFLVPSKFLRELKVGMHFKIAVEETGQTVDVTLSRMGATIDPSSRTVKIEAEVDNAEGQLRAGMSGRALIEDEISAELRRPTEQAEG